MRNEEIKGRVTGTVFYLRLLVLRKYQLLLSVLPNDYFLKNKGGGITAVLFS
jgi:hypothetical protein